MSTTGRIKRKWTEEEDQALRVEAYSQVKQGAIKDWHRIAAKLPGRTNKDCRKRWSKVCESIKKGVWDAVEDKALEAAVLKYGFRWTQVAQIVGTRHGDQCAKRWQHFLDPSLDHSEWIAAEDERLLAAVDKYGRNWTTITNNIFPGRSPTNVKNRHAILDRRRQAALGQQQRSKRKASNPDIDSADDLSVSVSDDESSSAEEQSEPASISPGNYSVDHSLLNTFSDSSTVSTAPQVNNSRTTLIPALDDFMTPGTFSPYTWPGDPKILATWDTSTAPMGSLENTAMESAPDVMNSVSDVWKMVGDGVKLKTVLTLEDVHPNTLSKVLDVLVKTRTKVTMETHQ